MDWLKNLIGTVNNKFGANLSENATEAELEEALLNVDLPKEAEDTDENAVDTTTDTREENEAKESDLAERLETIEQVVDENAGKTQELVSNLEDSIATSIQEAVNPVSEKANGNSDALTKISEAVKELNYFKESATTQLESLQTENEALKQEINQIKGGSYAKSEKEVQAQGEEAGLEEEKKEEKKEYNGNAVVGLGKISSFRN